ncbi:hypothetical protein MAR_004164 [Mya arenaria]|uniref:Uncharacterized protein n=1 Tax=Mya arenaria TaxID=6604 RepID=A0ABY7F006_MYAAR|nr:hypothetical protein MAR_004164 [Mya arenaria]
MSSRLKKLKTAFMFWDTELLVKTKNRITEIKFDKQNHSDEMKVWIKGMLGIQKWFRVSVRVNQEVRVDHQVNATVTPQLTKQENPYYTTDPGCDLIGTVVLENSTDIPYEQQVIETTFMFGDTEILVKTKNTITGKETFLTFECFK